MDQQRIIKFERGVLHMKLREDFNPGTMEIHCTLAEVSHKGVRVVKADSKGEVSSTSMCLTAEEFTLLRVAWEMVEDWWKNGVLDHRHVLLECGHILNWDEHQESLNRWTTPPHTYEMPHQGNRTYCWECESELAILRFNLDDFIESVE